MNTGVEWFQKCLSSLNSPALQLISVIVGLVNGVSKRSNGLLWGQDSSIAKYTSWGAQHSQVISRSVKGCMPDTNENYNSLIPVLGNGLLISSDHGGLLSLERLGLDNATCCCCLFSYQPMGEGGQKCLAERNVYTMCSVKLCTICVCSSSLFVCASPIQSL